MKKVFSTEDGGCAAQVRYVETSDPLDQCKLEITTFGGGIRISPDEADELSEWLKDAASALRRLTPQPTTAIQHTPKSKWKFW